MHAPPDACCSAQDAPAIDWQDLLESVGDDPVVLREVVQAYSDEASCELVRLQTSLASGELATAEKSSHKLKCAVRFFRQDATAAKAQLVEDAAEHGDQNGANAAMTDLGPRVEQLLAAVKAWLG